MYWNDYVVKARERQAKEDGFNDGFDNGKDIGYNERNYEVARNLILNDVSTNNKNIQNIKKIIASFGLAVNFNLGFSIL